MCTSCSAQVAQATEAVSTQVKKLGASLSSFSFGRRREESPNTSTVRCGRALARLHCTRARPLHQLSTSALQHDGDFMVPDPDGPFRARSKLNPTGGRVGGWVVLAARGCAFAPPLRRSARS